MDTDKILTVVNENPEEILAKISFGFRQGIKITVDGAECRIVRDNINGGAVVFSPGGVFNLKWNQAEKKWRA